MAKEVDTGMEKPAMKRLLGRSSEAEPINCAFAFGEDKATALAMFDKIKGPRALLGEITKKYTDTKFPSFGTAFVDTEDQALVKLTINKAVPGLGKRLIKTLRGTGFKRVMFFDESGALLESVGDDEEDGQAADTAPPDTAPTDTAPTDTAPSGQSNGAASQTGQSQGLVAKRVFLLERWKKIPDELRGHVSTVNQRIAERLPHEDAGAFSGQMTAWFDDMLGAMQTELDDAIDASINAGDQNYRPVATVLGQFRARVAGDELVAFMKQSDLLEGAIIETAFVSAIDEIDTALTR